MSNVLFQYQNCQLDGIHKEAGMEVGGRKCLIFVWVALLDFFEYCFVLPACLIISSWLASKMRFYTCLVEKINRMLFLSTSARHWQHIRNIYTSLTSLSFPGALISLLNCTFHVAHSFVMISEKCWLLPKRTCSCPPSMSIGVKVSCSLLSAFLEDYFLTFYSFMFIFYI